MDRIDPNKIKKENCEKKDRYETYDEANAVRVHLGYTLSIYKCDVCGGYHFSKRLI
ncbi:MAG: hypothetical protein LBK53_07530 [Heliobacteriaceae bacterium]|jgi:hypothetical protein|nr:hypothetical protein [Heliobacteriaceae bacterium]